MHREIRIKAALRMGAAASLMAWTLSAQAQNAPMQATAPSGAASGSASGASISLRLAFDAAWARQPEAQALPARRDAARAAQQAAQAWTPEPMALEASGKSDRLNRNQGSRELEVGIAVPLWLPGERARSQTLAQAEGRAVESRASAAQLRVAAAVREAWWQWQLARLDAEVARGQVDNARRIAADVAKRAQAGDLARSDRNQADGAVAAAESSLAQAEAALAVAGQQLQAATGLSVAAAATAASDTAGTAISAEAEPSLNAPEPTAHAALAELQDQAALAQGAAALAATQSRASPEVTLAVTRERGASAEPTLQTLTLGIRIPFGSGPRHNARVASALAERTEAEARLALERQRLLAERESAAARLSATRTQLAAAERRARLATETRGFFDRSFRLGETDLPTRLRIEAEATEAERQAARARIEVAAAISAQRQALGLLPD